MLHVASISPHEPVDPLAVELDHDVFGYTGTAVVGLLRPEVDLATGTRHLDDQLGRTATK